MRQHGTRSRSWASSTLGRPLLAASLVAVAIVTFGRTNSAVAQGDPAGATQQATPPAMPPAATSGQEAPDTSPDPLANIKPAEPTPDTRVSYVEHLPASAYPDPPRGIYGGSLWLGTFHGLQWPYVPRTGVGISGSAWVDTGYEKITRGGGHPDTVYWLQQGRAVLRLTPTYSRGSLFVQAQAELVANKDQSVAQPNVADTDDLWVRIGDWNKWDLQAGRFEAWEVYHLGMGFDLNTLERQGAKDTSLGSPPDFYGVTTAFYRPSGVGNLALHIYPWRVFRLEVLGQAGNEGGNNALGSRVAYILDLGWLKIKGASEYRRTTPVNGEVEALKDQMGNMVLDPVTMQPVLVKITNKELKNERGSGGSIQLLLNPYLEFGFNGAAGLVDAFDRSGGQNAKASYTVVSSGLFANVRIVEDLVLGVGLNLTTLNDLNRDSEGKVGHYQNSQAFGALQLLVAKQLFIKGVVAYAKATFDPSFDQGTDINFSNTMLSARVRFLYLF